MTPTRKFSAGIAFVALVLTPVLVLGAVYGLGYEPQNPAADAPRHEPDSDLIRAVVAGCLDSGASARTEISGGTWTVRCDPSVGMGPRVARRTR
jgi:hypothetical protein